jgi:hypothetical protein
MALRDIFGTGPSQVWRFRFEREDGEFREISVPVGLGRFKQGSEEEARTLAEQRLQEQFGDAIPDNDRGATARELMAQYPDLHQENYRFVSARRLR